MDKYLVNDVCGDLNITRPDDGNDDDVEFVPTTYTLEYALNARFMWNTHGMFPNGKCYDDQDPSLIEDINRLNARYNYHANRLKELAGKEWSGEDSDSDPFGGGNDLPAMTLDQIRG